MTIIDSRADENVRDTGAWQIADYTPTPVRTAPGRSRRSTLLGWVLLLVFLLAVVIAVVLIGTPDSSAAGGCGGG